MLFGHTKTNTSLSLTEFATIIDCDHI